jgi:CO/xanthine dehydrogenase FAD-binding subunit
MRGSASSMTVLRPRTVHEALAAYANASNAIPLVGGTDLMVSWNLGELNDRVILDLSGLADWSRITETKTGLYIGAFATHTQLQQHPVVQKDFPLLAKACATVGGVQIQNRGTIGGNIANASPAGDTFPPLAIYDARVHIASTRGRRVLPFLDIFAGVKKTTLRGGELIEAIELPFLEYEPSIEMFRKVGTRAAQAISKTVAAAMIWFSEDEETVWDLRFALGSMAPTVRRLRKVEAYVRGRKLTPAVIAEASKLLKADVSPIDDVRSTAAYRLATSQRLLEYFLGPEPDVEP